MDNSTSGVPTDPFEAGLRCVPLSLIRSSTLLMILLSVVFNCFVLRLSWNEFSRSTYTVCLVSMSVNNLVASCISLPLFYIEYFTTSGITHIPLQLANVLCFGRYVSIFTCLTVGLSTLNIICWDRYEALTIRLGRERRITPIVAGRIIVAAVLLVVVFLVTSNTSVLKYMADGNSICFSTQNAQDFQNNVEKKAQTSSIPVMVFVALLFTSSKAIAIFTFSSIAKQIRKHIKEVRQTLGNQNTVKELNMVKVSIVIYLAYTVTWLPYGISRGLMNAMPTSSPISCFYILSLLWAYSLFSFLPLLCICTDKKMKSQLRRTFRCSRRVAQAAIPNTISTNRTTSTL